MRFWLGHQVVKGTGAGFRHDAAAAMEEGMINPVGVRGLEPPTSASQTPRATDCATPRESAREYSAGITLPPDAFTRVAACGGASRRQTGRQAPSPLIRTG